MDKAHHFTFKTISVVDPLLWQITDKSRTEMISRHGNILTLQGLNGLILPVSTYEVEITLHPLMRQFEFRNIERNRYDFIVNDTVKFSTILYDVVIWSKSIYLVPEDISPRHVIIKRK